MPGTVLIEGELLKRSEWLRRWNRRHVRVLPNEICWFSADGKPMGSLALDKGSFITTNGSSADGKLIIKSQGREVQFRHVGSRGQDWASKQVDWLQAVQTAARSEV